MNVLFLCIAYEIRNSHISKMILMNVGACERRWMLFFLPLCPVLCVTSIVTTNNEPMDLIWTTIDHSIRCRLSKQQITNNTNWDVYCTKLKWTQTVHWESCIFSQFTFHFKIDKIWKIQILHPNYIARTHSRYTCWILIRNSKD